MVKSLNGADNIPDLLSSHSSQLASKANQSDLNITNANVTANTNKFGQTSNLFDVNKATPNAYLNSSGGINTYTAGGVSDFIPVTAGNVYTYVDQNNNKSATINCAWWFKADKTPLSQISNPSNLINTVTAPTNAAYLRVSYGNTVVGDMKIMAGGTLNESNLSYLPYVETPTKFYGKKISFLGDSITYGYGLPFLTTQRFSAIVSQRLGTIEDNEGSSGTHIAQQSGVGGEMCTRYVSCNPDAELVVVMGGINDYYLGTGVMGAVDSTDNTTFYGALNNLITGLQNRYPSKDIIFMTPYSANSSTNGHNTDVANTYSNAVLKDYRDAIIARCLVHGVPVLDLFASIGFDLAHNSNHVTQFSQDGLHPNIYGHQRIADRLIRFIKTL